MYTDVAAAAIQQPAATAGNNRAAAIKLINAIEPQELSKTPIAASLAEVGEDLIGINGERIVILVTDGEETCGGDPESAIRKLAASGIDIRVNIVGFAIDEYALRKSFESWAQLGNGAYIDVQNADDLQDAISQAVNAPFEIVDSTDNVIATGTTNGDAVSLPVGSYKIRLRSNTVGGITASIAADEETVVILD